jgi:hypothetical protein
MAERLCRHEPCHCEPDAGAEYCDACCARADQEAGSGPAGSRCDCGHPECRPENVSPDQPSPIAQP